MVLNSSQPNVLTDRLLRSWIKCRRRAWLDLYGDQTKRIWTAHRSLQLDHQQRHFNCLLKQSPKRGHKALIAGAESVIGIRLKANYMNIHKLEVHPTLLKKVSGNCKWGEFSYIPVISRQGRRITREHRLALAITAKLLEPFQEAAISHGLAVGDSQGKLQLEKIEITEALKKQLSSSLSKMNIELTNNIPPPLATDRRKCATCSWKGICNAEAIKEGHLSVVSGVGQRRREMLNEIGIEDLKSLAIANPKTLSLLLNNYGIQHGEAAAGLIAQAKVQWEGEAKRINKKVAIPELNSAEGVFLYDIESDPDEKNDFLHGFLSLKRTNGCWDIKKAKYHPLLILKGKNSNKVSPWERIKKKLYTNPEWPILHYGETEAVSLFSIAMKEGATKNEIIVLKKRLIDVHQRLTGSWRLPLSSYGLKSVATWLGFKWSNQRADGAKALLWWRHWNRSDKRIKTKANLLKWIFNYNQDDCLATWEVASWLMKEDLHPNLCNKD